MIFTLVCFQALDSSPPVQEQVTDSDESDESSSAYEGSFLDDFSDSDSCADNEVLKPIG